MSSSPVVRVVTAACAGVAVAVALLAVFAGMGVALVVLLGIVALVTCVPVWFAPVLLARRRGVADVRPIAVCTLLAGWSLIGWVAALIWAGAARAEAGPRPVGT
ncbi:superinfection immunity protein [Amycolatopsis tucumanensis]|uniref:superinfection immunity protein n=1 Tax=Amycolatopsis tucumanensis TaxID=401106 RepID=UPI003D754AF8